MIYLTRNAADTDLGLGQMANWLPGLKSQAGAFTSTGGSGEMNTQSSRAFQSDCADRDSGPRKKPY
jgi:hypothetical protein